MMSNRESCGRTLPEGGFAAAVDGVAYCSACFEEPTDGSDWIEGPMPVAATCGRSLGPPPPVVVEPRVATPGMAPIAPQPSAGPQAPSLMAGVDSSDDAKYVRYVQGCILDQQLPVSFDEWAEARSATADDDGRLGELLDAAVQTVVGVVEAAYLLGREHGRG